MFLFFLGFLVVLFFVCGRKKTKPNERDLFFIAAHVFSFSLPWGSTLIRFFVYFFGFLVFRVSGLQCVPGRGFSWSRLRSGLKLHFKKC